MKIRILVALLIVLTLSGCDMSFVVPTPTPIPSKTPIPTLRFSCSPNCTYEDMTVAFIQTQSEGSWMRRNYFSLNETAHNLGIRLMKFEPRYIIVNPHETFLDQQRAFREFIADGDVDVIVINAFESMGWDETLWEAKAAGKIVIFEYLRVDAPEELYDTFVGSDYVEEGRKAGREMIEWLADALNKNVVELAGDASSPIAHDRGRGFREGIEGSDITIIRSETANWSAQEGKQAMETILMETKDIQGVFVQNDEMAYGAVEAIKEAGLIPGIDIIVVSIDASRVAYELLIVGESNVTVECNPDLATLIYEAALKAMNGEELPRWIIPEEGVLNVLMPDLYDIYRTRFPLE